MAVDAGGRLVQPYEHAVAGRGLWVLDEASLEPVDEIAPWTRYPSDLLSSDADQPGMQVNWAADSGAAADGREYALRWESLEPNRDRERAETPSPTSLRVYGFESGP